MCSLTKIRFRRLTPTLLECQPFLTCGLAKGAASLVSPSWRATVMSLPYRKSTTGQALNRSICECESTDVLYGSVGPHSLRYMQRKQPESSCDKTSCKAESTWINIIGLCSQKQPEVFSQSSELATRDYFSIIRPKYTRIYLRGDVVTSEGQGLRHNFVQIP